MFGQKIQEAVQILYDNLPRTIVSLTGMFHLEMLRQVDTGQFFCQALHVYVSYYFVYFDKSFADTNVNVNLIRIISTILLSVRYT